MKKIIFIAAVILTALNGCDYLDVVPDNTATLEMAFHDRYNAEKFLFTCYSFIPSHGSEYGDPGILAGDELWINEYVNRDGFRIAKGEQNSDNPLLNYWTGTRSGKKLYVGIRDCNIFIDNIDNVGDLPDYEKTRWKAEVKFIKAYLHFYLLRMYGPIPLLKENISINAPTEEFMGRRAPVDECFKYVLDLMSEAAEDLPNKVPDEATELGRITKPIALAIKARVALTYASPLFNGNSDFSGLTDKEGNKLFNDTYDPSRWQTAVDACKEAIDVCEESGHRLWQLSDFNINRGTFSLEARRRIILRQAVSERWNPEIIWGNSSSLVGYYQNRACPVYRTHTGIYPTNQFLSATLRVAEQFYSKNGVPIDEDKQWDYGTRYDITNVPLNDSIKLYLAPGETTAKLHFAREPRFYSSLAFDRGAWVGNGTDSDSPWYVRARIGEPAYKLGERWMYGITGYWPKKMINVESEISQSGWFTYKTYPFPVIRMADMYLMYAEALNELNGPSDEAYRYIDMIRERAGLKGVVESWRDNSTTPNKPGAQEGLRSIIHRERLIELAFEGERFWDLRRWKEAKSLMNDPIRGWNTLSIGDATDWYTINTYFVQEFKVRDYLWPISEHDLLTNTHLVQNPGW